MAGSLYGCQCSEKLKFSKDVFLQVKLLNGMQQSLDEVRCPRLAVELATMHTILTASVTSSHNTLTRQCCGRNSWTDKSEGTP